MKQEALWIVVKYQMDKKPFSGVLLENQCKIGGQEVSCAQDASKMSEASAIK